MILTRPVQRDSNWGRKHGPAPLLIPHRRPQAGKNLDNIDAGGGLHNDPEDYAVISDSTIQRLLTLPIAYIFFPQQPKQELEDFSKWIQMTGIGRGTGFYRVNRSGDANTTGMLPGG